MPTPDHTAKAPRGIAADYAVAGAEGAGFECETCRANKATTGYWRLRIVC